ncbi:MAG: hypothetical protein LQ341_007031 [Variospora aurantia]|nr:MAG: hypothetical protein LQ341_007031 [Variospora aurantia]
MSLSPSIQDILRTTYFAILLAINTGSLNAAEHVTEYLAKHDAELTLSLIMVAVMPYLDALVNGLRNCFSGLDLKDMANGTFSSLQGVYGILCFFRNHEDIYRLYIGSSYGKTGLQHRIYSNHFNASYRAKEKSKYLYCILEREDVKAFPVCLAQFKQAVEPPVVLLLEALITTVLGTYRLETYQTLRHSKLPRVDWLAGVNQCDPLLTGDSSLMWIDAAKAKRRANLENAKAGGPVRIRQHWNGAGKWFYWNIPVGCFKLRMPRAVADDWALVHGDMVNLEYNVTLNRHPNVYALAADDKDDASKLGIRAMILMLMIGEKIGFRSWVVKRNDDG